MGWLGWTPAETLAANVNDVQIAIEGRTEFLRLLFGSDKKANAKPRKVTAEEFRVMARRHNARWKRERAGKDRGQNGR